MRILYNATIHTLEANHPKVSALAIDRGKILMLGSSDEVRAQFDGVGIHQDIERRVIIPGLTDAHIHLSHYALGLQKVICEVDTRAECLRRIADSAQNTPLGQWILGHGWNQNLWADGFGNAQHLDEVAPHHPVYLTAKSLHAGWANSTALNVANITAQTPDPADGKIQRDEHGNPTGILLEGAMALVGAAVPEPQLDEVVTAIKAAQSELWKLGVTGVHDFDRRQCFAALQCLHQDENLNLRVLKSIPLDDLSHAVEIGLRSGFGNDMLRIGSVKVFADGALGPHTAAMLQPFENAPDNRGMLLMDQEEIFEKGRLAVEYGLSLAIHAIGDRANHEVLNAYEKLREYEQSLRICASQAALRHRIEHVQLIHPKDVSRLADLGIIASMQPIHATSDMVMAADYWGERSALSYAWKTQLDQGATLALGSDAPVESPNPFWGLHAAVTRRRTDGSPGIEGWYPEQRINLTAALQGFTQGPAYAAGMEDRLGKLAPGYLADLLVLETDPFECDPHEIKDLLPTKTMVGGEWVFERDT
jgi:predicted amidohydrolase YtcJ